MSEARKNAFEIRAAWLGFAGSVMTAIVGLVMAVMNLSIISHFPGTVDEYKAYFFMEGAFSVVTDLTVILPGIYWMTFLVGVVGILFSLYRTNIGIRLSGVFLWLTASLSIACLVTGISVLAFEELNITTIVNNPQELATYGITVPHALFWPAIALSVFWFIGSFFMMAAAPMNEAKYRTRRMKTLARADTAERTGKPREAIQLYSQAGDISMKLREEDKASEYYAKSREIREVAIQAVLEAEEKRKREELAARRSKLEEQRREILMRADRAEEKEDWARGAVIYKEAASLSVDLGEKKLAAQFTAKAKELQKRAKKARKESKEPPPSD